MSTAKQVTIYTRGVTSPLGAGGYGAILLCDTLRKELSGSAPDSSNNRMDILAAIEALRALKSSCRVTLYNTNTYLTDAISKGWAQRWRTNGWRNSEQRPTPHTELWEELLGLCAAHEVVFEYRRFDGENDVYARCDALAHDAALREVTSAKEELVQITAELLEAAISARGGGNREQLACLGVAWPPPSGWKATAEGRFMRRAEVERFLALKSEDPGTGASLGLFKDKREGGVEPGGIADRSHDQGFSKLKPCTRVSRLLSEALAEGGHRMPLELTHIGESVVSTMIDAMRWEFVELCGLVGRADRALLSEMARPVVHANANLAAYGGLGFDGASCVDLVLRLQENLGVSFELKLGETRLTKSHIDEEWLSGCEPSHQGKRWKGNMMSILERKFPTSSRPDVLKARLPDGEVPLANEWFIIARSWVIESWTGAGRPDFSRNVHLIAFEAIVDKFGGKEPFNDLVRRLLSFDFYSAWVESS